MGNYVSIYLFMDMHFSLIIFDFSVSINILVGLRFFMSPRVYFFLNDIVILCCKKKSSENVRQYFAVYIDPTYRAYHSQMMLLK